MPINEPLRSRDITGYQPFLAGWGTTSYKGSPSSILQDVQIPIVSTTDCGSNYRAFFPNQVFDNRIICAGFGGKDACQGDSGGPLMLPQVIVARLLQIIYPDTITIINSLAICRLAQHLRTTYSLVSSLMVMNARVRDFPVSTLVLQLSYLG